MTSQLPPREPTRFNPYPAYKDSGVEWLGEIPAHWEVKRLKALASVELSNVDKKFVEGQEAVQLCNYTDVYYNERITRDLEFMPATATREQVRRFSLRAGDVLITKDSESWTDIAVPAVVVQDLPGVLCGYHLALIRPAADYDGAFLGRAFAADGPRDQFQIAANGITRFGLGGDAIRTGLFAMPPILEQRSIAAFLDRETARIDGLVARKERLIELLQEKRTALITRAATKGLAPNVPMKDSGVEWLGEIAAHWNGAKMWRISRAMSGGTPAREERAYWDGDIPWVSPKDMKRRVIDSSEDAVTKRAIEETGIHLIPPPVVLIVVRGMILAHSFPVAITAVPVTINQDMKALTFRSGIHPTFMMWLFEGVGKPLLAAIVEEAAHGTRAIRMDKWRSVTVPVPPEPEQRAIAAFLDRETARIDALVATVREAIERLKELRIALTSAAVTGKIDVREEVP
ncbi:MAG: restriction endonuclease subunit S [Longimicrobiales bacterium]